MSFTLKKGAATGAEHEEAELATFPGGQCMWMSEGRPSYDLRLEDGSRLLLFGEVFYHVTSDGEPRLVDPGDTDALQGIFSSDRLTEVIARLEGQYVGVLVDPTASVVRLFSDRWARIDTFWAQEGGAFVISSDLDAVFREVEPQHDQLMLAHMLMVYGWYVPKGLTIYANVKQLRVGEILTVSESGVASETMPFVPLTIEEYGDDMLERYWELLRFSIVARAERDGTNWVSSSSGWDSSTVLGVLVHELGPKSVGMVTGSMKYSPTTDIINKFEIEKVRRIGKFYGIEPEITSLDFASAKAADYWTRVLPHYRSRHIYSYPSFNLSRISDKARHAGGVGAVIFNGEASDSFHNFGFSQFVTFLHTKKAFTEYADKMNCYLYGPSFLQKVLDGSHTRDKVFQIFARMSPGVEFAEATGDREADLEAYFFPFFYGAPRLPFAKTWANPALTPAGREAIYHFPCREYEPRLLKELRPENVYSWWIYLYNSFHSQGSTVNLHKHAMDLNGLRWRSPFNDYRLIELLSKAPESWGRGLELNHTKYPLKWAAQHKFAFPYDLLDEGPHSYLYDVIEGFSLASEITYRSGVVDFFKTTLAQRPYRELFSEEFVDVCYLDRIVDGYLAGDEARGDDFNNLVSLITLCVTGWY